MYTTTQLCFAVFAGLIVGAIILILYYRSWISPLALRQNFVDRPEFEDALNREREIKELSQKLERELAAANMQADHLSDSLESAQTLATDIRKQLAAVNESERKAALQLTQLNSELSYTRQRLSDQRADFEVLHKQSKTEFESISSALLKSSGQALREEHQRSLLTLLDPVKTKLHEFQEQVDRKFTDESKDKASLKTQIQHLTELNQNLSSEARALTQALKGDSKSQGDWGELQLERLLEAAGLQSSTHFDTQSSFKNAEGRQQRPDCIVRLPGTKCIVIDSKVSLTAYERFCASDETESHVHLAAHVSSVRNHIKGLSAKAYQELYQIDCPDYVLLFIPLEPAFIAAVRERPTLFTEALTANVVLVSPSTLLATMRTVAYIWQQDDQRNNALEIAEVGAKLYDKFVGFVEDMDNVGTQIDKAKDTYDSAMNKLSRSPKYNTTLVARASELKALGVTTKRTLQPGK